MRVAVIVAIYGAVGLALVAFILIVKSIWPYAIPYDLFKFFFFPPNFFNAVLNCWPIFLWGTGLTILGSILSANMHVYNLHAEEIFKVNILVSVIAGVSEEIAFRWLAFFCAMPGILLLNTIGFGIPEWLYKNIFFPITNFLSSWMTQGVLTPILFGSPWWIGAALVSANGRFQDQHKYLGPFGHLNSWFLGMYFFALMFTQGIFVAMVVHFLYDFFIFAARYIDAVLERKLGISAESVALRHRQRKY